MEPTARSLFRLSTLPVLSLFLLSGCATYTKQTQERDTAFRTGNLAAAAAQADADGRKKHQGKDGILHRLEQGAILRAAALAPGAAPDVSRDYLARSNAALDAAEARVNEFEEKAKVKVASETASMLTNLANLPYRGRAYDKVMLSTYKALNHLQLGDTDTARVELNRALQRQRDAVAENARHIAEAEEDARNAATAGADDAKGGKATYDVGKATADPTTAASLENILAGSTTAAAARPYADYVNPFAVLLDGLYFATHAADDSDRERAIKSLERVAGMAPENPFVRDELAGAAAGRRPAGVTHVIVENGIGPWREETRVDLPLFIVTDKISYIGAAFPSLKFHDNALLSEITITAAGAAAPVAPALVCDMDAVVARDFKNEWPAVVTKTILSTAIKGTINAVAQKQAKDKLGASGGLAVGILGGVAQGLTTIADTRAWRTLPKQFSYARLDTPADRALVINAGGQPHNLQLPEGDVIIVYIKSIAAGTPLLVSQFKLK
ncbi:MAG: hypothetical protein LBC18_09485 [Opitutaceae bacterium]|jgi:hypothetical protein|nr:hypothetical protein [Opitutaceae bacterium]